MSSSEDVNPSSTSTSASTMVKTGDEDDSPASFSVVIGTSSESTDDQIGLISILIRDKEGYSTDRTLLRYSHSHNTPFMRGHSDLFIISNQPSLGQLESAEIHYNASEEISDKPWKLNSLNVLHHESGKVYNFQLDTKQSTNTVMTMICKDEPVQVVPVKLPNPFK